MPESASRTTCSLPGGYLDQNGKLHREAALRPLSGREEELLAGMEEAVPAAQVTRLLACCVDRIGSVQPVSEDVARRLLIADRQYLLLQLRRLTFGDCVDATLACSWPDCGKKMDIDFSIDDIPITPVEERAPTYTVSLSPEAAWRDENGLTRDTVTFRLPDGGDQEQVAHHLASNPAQALTMLLARCVVKAAGEVSTPVERLSSRARREIEQAMQARVPRVEMDMEVTCPECGRDFTVPFDVQDFFFGELRTSRDLLYRQVHYLAYHYNWSERDILDMSREKRHRYIEILADEIEAMNNAV